MLTLLSLVLILSAVAAILSWRKGMYSLTVAAIVQDPLRKLVPDEPVYLTLAAAAVLAFAVLNGLSRGMNIRPRQIAGWSSGPAVPFALSGTWILIQSLHSLTVYGNPLVTAVGLVTYVAPIPAIILGFHFAVRTGPAGVLAWLRFNLVLVGLALATVVLDYTGVRSDLFGQVGVGMKIYDVGTVLIGKTGTFRSTEVAAWHATAAACFAFIVLTSPRLNNRRVALAVAIAAAMIGIAVLTGRRKSIIAFVGFATTYLFLFSILSRNFHSWLLGFLAVAATLFLVVGGLLDDERDVGAAEVTEYQLFLERGRTVFDDAPERLVSMSLGQAEWATRVTGMFGAGVGVATSGARHVGRVGADLGGVGEGGLGKVMAELGVPGLLLIAWFMFALSRQIWRNLKFTAWRSPQVFRLSAGLVAFLMANGMIFVVNTQIFNDFFILIVLGLALGFLLAMPVLAERSPLPAPRTTRPAALWAAAGP